MHLYFSFPVFFMALCFSETGEAGAAECEPIVAKTCRGSGVLHRYTSTPIKVPYGPGPEDQDHFLTQRDAIRKLRQYLPLFKSGKGCHEYLKPLMCSVFLPSCDEYTGETAIPPCRDICEMALAKCATGLRHHGLDWPPQFDCARFPTATENSRCISVLGLGGIFISSVGTSRVEVQVRCTYGLLPELQLQWLAPDGSKITEDETSNVFASMTDKQTSTLTIRQYTDSSNAGNYTCFVDDKGFSLTVPLEYIHEPLTDPGSCEPIQDFLWCKNNVAFTHTQLPNAFEVISQYEIRHMIEKFLPVLMSGCSHYLGTLICGVALPRCNASYTNKFAVCRDVCLRVIADCAEVFEATGIGAPPCEDLVPQAEGDCYNGLEIGPVNVYHSADSNTSRRVEVECRHAENLNPSWITPTANLTKSSVGQQVDHIEVVNSEDDVTVFRLIIHNFIDSRDAGIYTCSDGDTFSRSITIDNIYQPSKEVEIGDLQVLGSGYSIDCTYNLHPPLQPKWLSPRGKEIPTDSSSRIRVGHTEASVTTLYIGSFQSATDGGLYSCFGKDLNSGQTVLIESQDIPVNVTNTEVPTDQSPCEEIRIPACSVGIGYSSTYVPNLVGLSQDDMGFIFNAMGIIFETSCSPYLRPYMCSLYLPPCRERALPPCREMCSKALRPCLATLRKFISQGELDSMLESCTGLPSSEDVDSQCYNAKEVEIGDLRVVGSNYSIDCTYNLHPALQPTWLFPSGREISTDPSSRIRVGHTEANMTTLYIGGFQSATDGGLYSCFGRDLNSGQTVLIDSQDIQVNFTNPEVPTEQSVCEEIRIPACSVGIGYSSTYVPNLVGISQDDMRFIFAAMGIIFETSCSPYLRPYMCSLYLPPCRERALPPCREMCSKALRPCLATLRRFISQGELDSMRESCTGLPSSEDVDSQCYNVPDLEIGEPRVAGPHYTVNCTYNLLPSQQPRWLLAAGEEISTDSSSRIRVVHTSESVTTLYFENFNSVVDGGRYSCFGQDLAFGETIVIGDLPENTTFIPVIPEVPEPPCEEIRIPACSIGIGYTSTYVPSLVGLGQDQLGSVFNGLDVIFDQPCSPYFRPYMCALYVPPCREQAVLPCRELCISAVEQCAATLSNSFSVQDVNSMRESCTSMPSEADPDSQCHNVEELVLGAVEVDGSDYSVECTYNLLPAVQPEWRFPDGRDVSSAFWKRVRKVRDSDGVSRLLINDFSPASDSGTYTCVAGEHSVTLDL